MKRILFVIRQLTEGGTERRMLDLKESLDNTYDIKIVNLTGLDFFSKPANPDDYYSHWKKGRPMLSRFYALLRAIKKYNPDIIHCFDLESGLYSVLLKRLFRFGQPIISGYGAGAIEDKRILFMLRKRFLQPKMYICNSYRGANSLREALEVPITIKVVHNGLNPERYMSVRNSPLPEWAQGQRPVVGYIGKLDQIKKGDRMVEVAISMKEHPRRPNFVIIGDGPNRPKVLQRVNSLSNDLKSRIFVLGHLSNAAIFAKHFDVGVLCSNSEGFPNVILEYMALGIPIVSTPVGDVPEILEKGKLGLLTVDFSIESLSEKIDFLLQNQNYSDQLRKVSIQKFNREYTFEKMGEKYHSLYAELLD